MTEGLIRVGTRAVIFNSDNKILVAHCLNPKDDFYFLPGGGARRVYISTQILL